MADSENPTQDPANPDPQPPPPPIIPSDSEAILGGAKATQDHEELEQTKKLVGESRRIERLQPWVNATLAVVGIIAIFVYFGELCTMNKTLGEIQKQTPEIQKQAAAAQGELAQMEYATRLDERAWIEIEPIVPKPYANSSDLHIYDLFLNNLGKSAARDIVVRADNFASDRQSIENTKHADWIHNMQDKYLLGKFKGDVPLNRGTPVPSVMGPGTVSPIAIRYVTQVPQFFPGGGEAVSEILGRVDYRDEFGIAHWIRYCFYPADVQGNLASCAAGNDEDHNPEIPAAEKPANPN